MLSSAQCVWFVQHWYSPVYSPCLIHISCVYTGWGQLLSFSGRKWCVPCAVRCCCGFHSPGSSWTPGTGASFPTGDCGAIHRSLSVHRPQPSGVSAGSENSIAVVICASTRPLVTSEECWQKTGKVWIINHSLEREETAIHREREKAWVVRMEWRG